MSRSSRPLFLDLTVHFMILAALSFNGHVLAADENGPQQKSAEAISETKAFDKKAAADDQSKSDKEKSSKGVKQAADKEKTTESKDSDSSPPKAESQPKKELKKEKESGDSPPDSSKEKEPTKTTPPATLNPSPKPINAIPPDQITLECMDGTIVTGKLAIKEIGVETDYGNLRVPISSIASFTPGLLSHPALEKQFSGWIKDLGSSNFNDREEAQKQLAKIAPMTRKELDKYRNDSDAERRSRVTKILSELEEAEEDSDEQGPKHTLVQRDVIVTKDFTIVGKILPQSFDLTSKFGSLTVPLGDIRRAHREVEVIKEDQLKVVAVEGRNTALRTPLDSGIKLERGDKVVIKAEGTINITPWGGQGTVTPEGNPNYGSFMNNGIPMGALIGRVGADQFFKVGTRYEFTADKPGLLQLAIAMQQDYGENQIRGKFSVKIRVIKKQ